MSIQFSPTFGSFGDFIALVELIIVVVFLLIHTGNAIQEWTTAVNELQFVGRLLQGTEGLRYDMHFEHFKDQAKVQFDTMDKRSSMCENLMGNFRKDHSPPDNLWGKIMWAFRGSTAVATLRGETTIYRDQILHSINRLWSLDRLEKEAGKAAKKSLRLERYKWGTITLIDGVGESVQFPRRECQYFEQFTSAVRVWCEQQKPFGYHLIKNGSFRLLHGSQLEDVIAGDWTYLVAEDKFKVEMSMVVGLRKRTAATWCPKCFESARPRLNGFKCIARNCRLEFDITAQEEIPVLLGKENEEPGNNATGEATGTLPATTSTNTFVAQRRSSLQRQNETPPVDIKMFRRITFVESPGVDYATRFSAHYPNIQQLHLLTLIKPDTLQGRKILEIISSKDFMESQAVSMEELKIFVQIVRHDNQREGTRGGPKGFKCVWEIHDDQEEAQICGKLVKRREHMFNHVRSHFNIRPYKCTYDHDISLSCDTGFRRLEDLRRHVRAVHDMDLDRDLNIITLVPRVRTRFSQRSLEVKNQNRVQ